MANYILRNDDLMEERVFGNYSFPLEVFNNTLSIFEHGFVEPHWHPEIEFTVVQKGSMEYHVNDCLYQVKEGEAIFSNSKCLHSARPFPNVDCYFYSIVFNPVLLVSHENSDLNHYVDELVELNEFPSLFLSSEIPWQRKLVDILNQIETIYQMGQPGYDLMIKGRLCELWAILYVSIISSLQNCKPHGIRSIQQVKKMLVYIQNNYSQKVSLDDIASAVNLSKSECCRLFKKVMKQSPINYLINYRVQKSLPLLLARELSITQVAEQTGFQNPSYFSEVFKLIMSSSPTEYQKTSIQRWDNTDPSLK